MKKKSQYILIPLIIILFGFFSTSVLHAQNSQTIQGSTKTGIINGGPIPSTETPTVNSTIPQEPLYIMPLQGTTINVSACGSGAGISKIICQIQQILNSIVPILVALGLVYFVWGVVQYVIAGGEEAKTKGRERMIYGIIGFAVIVGVWGLVNIVVNTFGLSGITAPSLAPLIGTGTGGSSCASIGSGSTLQNVLCYVTGIINNSIIPLIFAVAIAMFVWGVVKFFIINSDEEAKREQGKQYMIWGIIALAVMLSVWGLVGILETTFGIKTSILPQVCPPGSNCTSGQ